MLKMLFFVWTHVISNVGLEVKETPLSLQTTPTLSRYMLAMEIQVEMGRKYGNKRSSEKNMHDRDTFTHSISDKSEHLKSENFPSMTQRISSCGEGII
jgi:hypothetical protein